LRQQKKDDFQNEKEDKAKKLAKETPYDLIAFKKA